MEVRSMGTLRIALLGLVALSAGCAASHPSTTPAPKQDAGAEASVSSPVQVEIDNQNYSDMDVYLVNNGMHLLLGSAPGLIGSDRSLPLHALRRSPWQVVLFRSIDRCAVPIRDTISEALVRGSFTDAMGRILPLGAAVVMLTAPTIDGADLVAPLLGQQLASVATINTGSAGSVSGDDRVAWLRREVLDPLAARFERQGHPLTFDQSFVDWLLAHLPADQTGQSVPPSDFIDGTVPPALAAGLPSGTGPVVATIVDDKPTLRQA